MTKSTPTRLLFYLMVDYCRTEKEEIVDNLCLSDWEEVFWFFEAEGVLEKINDRLYKIVRLPKLND
jgi:hypothetical protein